MALKIALVGAQTLEPECTHWKGISIGMKELGIDYFPIDWRALSSEQVLEQVNSIDDLDLLIWGLNDPFERQDIMRATKAKRRTYWCADLRDERTGGFPTWDLRGLLDFTCQSNAGLLKFWERHQQIPSYYVGQAGFEGEIIESPYANLDVVFIGGRIDSGLLAQRYNLFKAIDFPISWINEDTLEKRMEIYAQMPTIYSTAKICLEASQVWDVYKYSSARYFHIACNGGFSIAKRFEGCEELFPNHYGKLYFDTPEEATRLINDMLYMREERTAIAQRGKEWALKHHTYKNRIEEICKRL